MALTHKATRVSIDGTEFLAIARTLADGSRAKGGLWVKATDSAALANAREAAVAFIALVDAQLAPAQAAPKAPKPAPKAVAPKAAPASKPAPAPVVTPAPTSKPTVAEKIAAWKARKAQAAAPAPAPESPKPARVVTPASPQVRANRAIAESAARLGLPTDADLEAIFAEIA